MSQRVKSCLALFPIALVLQTLLQAQQPMTGMPEMKSMRQQASQPQAKPGAGSDASSITIPFQDLQEPEAIGFHTGADLPAPELLGAVVNKSLMTLDNFLDLAEKNNPTLEQAQHNIERSNQQARQMGLPPDPRVGYSGDHIRGGAYNGGEQGAFFSQQVVLGGKLALRSGILHAEAEANKSALEMQRARVRNDVGQAFFDALAAQLSVVIYDRLLKVALDGETNIHEFERIGQADAADVLHAEIAAEQAKVEFENAQRVFLERFTQLASSAGQASLEAHPLSGRLTEPPVIDPVSLVETDMRESPLVAQAQAQVKAAETRLQDAKRERIPDLFLKAGEWYSGETLGSTNLKAGWESFAEVSVNLPLWNRNQGNIDAAAAELQRSRKEILRAQLWTRHEASPFAQRYLRARSNAERYKTEMLPRARRAYQLELMKYKQMAQPYPRVLSAQQMLFGLQLTYVAALNDEWRAAIALKNFALTNGLEQPSSTGDDSTNMNLPTGGGQ